LVGPLGRESAHRKATTLIGQHHTQNISLSNRVSNPSSRV